MALRFRHSKDISDLQLTTTTRPSPLSPCGTRPTVGKTWRSSPRALWHTSFTASMSRTTSPTSWRMPPALGPTLTTVPGPALRVAPPQGPCCFHWLCSPYAPCSEGPGPTRAHNGQPAPLPLWPATWQPTLKGEAQATSSRDKRLLPASLPPGTLRGSDSWLCRYSLFTAFWPAGRVSLLGRQDTDCADSQSTLFFYQIYSPDPATSMEHSRSDLLSPIPSLWNTGSHSHSRSPQPYPPWREDQVCSG